MLLIDGKATAAAIRAELRVEVEQLAGPAGRKPGLTVLLVGDDAASQTYVRNKHKACLEVGMLSEVRQLPASTSQQELLDHITGLNEQPDVDGILLQLPLPKGLDSQRCLEHIRLDKDVDGFHPDNMGRLLLGLPGLRPCTPAGVMELLKRYNLSPKGKHAVIVGRSNIVGKPLAALLLAKDAFADATVTICHSGTPDLAEHTKRADFLFTALGQPEFIHGNMVKPGAVVVDVGISVTPQGLKGDCHFESVSQVAAALTPVPGGVGPMTIALLLRNTLQAFRQHTGL